MFCHTLCGDNHEHEPCFCRDPSQPACSKDGHDFGHEEDGHEVSCVCLHAPGQPIPSRDWDDFSGPCRLATPHSPCIAAASLAWDVHSVPPAEDRSFTALLKRVGRSLLPRDAPAPRSPSRNRSILYAAIAATLGGISVFFLIGDLLPPAARTGIALAIAAVVFCLLGRQKSSYPARKAFIACVPSLITAVVGGKATALGWPIAVVVIVAIFALLALALWEKPDTA